MQDRRHIFSKQFISGTLATLFLLGSLLAHANDNPRALLEESAVKMINAINDNREKINNDPAITQQLIEDILMPHLDFITASKYVLGSDWDKASKEQKIAFIKAFRTLLLRFYSSALTEYLANHDEKLDAKTITFQDPGKITTTQITVRSEVQPKSGKPVPVNYQMHKTGSGWKVFDVSVEGVSVITTYKTSFATEIQQDGIDKLIVSINERNAKLAAGEKDPALKKTSNNK